MKSFEPLLNAMALAGAAPYRLCLYDTAGQPVDLGDLTAGSPSVLVFYRGHWWSVCHHQFGELGKYQREIKSLNAVFCAVSYEDGQMLELMKMDHALGAGFKFLSDPVGELADGFAGTTDKGIHNPATFVLDGNLKPVFKFIHEDHHVRPSAEEVMNALKKVVENETGT